MNITEPLHYKIALIEHCKVLLNERVSVINSAIDEAQQAANEYGPPKDRYDAFRAQLLRKKDMMGQQLVKLLNEKNMLDKISTKKPLLKVEFGALVKTDKQTIFVAVGLGKISYLNEELFIVSPSVPLFLAMAGKKVGEKCMLNDSSFEILEIF